jgi:mono/diheme cytochrome c family protein
MFNLSSRVSQCLFFIAAFTVAVARPSLAQTPPPGRSAFGQPAGAGVFQRNCASCHTAQGVDLGGRVAPPVASLKAMAPEKIYAAMVNGGKMQAQA